MKRAVIRQRRTLADGRRLVQVACPICGVRHWLPADTTTHQCPRRPGVFALNPEGKNR